MRIFPTIRASRLVLAASLAVLSSLHAQTTWEGDVSTNWAASGNWNNGVPSTSKGAVLDDSSTVAFQPYTSLDQRLASSLTFNTAGWTIGTDGVGYVNLRNAITTATLISNGAGINTIGRLRTFATANVTVGADNTLEILDSNGNLSFTTKDGAGTLIIGGTAAAPVIPNVTAGTLLINSENYTPNVINRTISGGAVFGGSGALGTRTMSTIEFVDGAIFAPGAAGIGDISAGVFTTDASDSQASTQRFNLNMQSGSIFAIDIFADGSSDKALFSGIATNTSTAMTLANDVTLALSGTAAYNTAYRVAEFVGAGEYDSSFGTFDTISLNNVALSEGVDYSISYVDHTKFTAGTGYIEVTLIPEPSTLAMLVTALLATLLPRLRRRRD